jgi:hypothetical protein
MYYSEHQPPHFHAEYGGEEGLIVIGSGDLYQGRLTRRALRLVQKSEELHRAELLANWDLARTEQPLTQIAPLT